MKMVHKILISMILLVLPLTTMAQNDVEKRDTTDYGKLYEQAVKESLDLELQKETLETVIGNLRNKEAFLNDSVKAQQKKLEKTQADIDKLQTGEKYNRYNTLVDRRNALQTESETLETTLSALEAEYQKLLQKEEEKRLMLVIYERKRTEFLQDLIAKHRDKLDMPFSKISVREFESVRTELEPYDATPDVHEFITALDVVRSNKSLYDEIAQVLCERFDKEKIAAASQKAQSIVCHSPAQSKDVATLNSQLASFEPGIKILQDFITMINNFREDFKDAYSFYIDNKQPMLADNKLTGFEEKINAVPYLKSAYEKFMKEFKQNSSKHSDIESEILSQ